MLQQVYVKISLTHRIVLLKNMRRHAWQVVGGCMSCYDGRGREQSTKMHQHHILSLDHPTSVSAVSLSNLRKRIPLR